MYVNVFCVQKYFFCGEFVISKAITMEDSLEDYLRLSRNARKNVKTDQQEEIKSALITLQKKKESEARAMKIVEFMIEGRLRTETFLHCLLHINREYYQDIVEERALNKICGYPICSEKIPEMPRKQFHISFKANKVYDITDRKNYCSNFCYKASLHIKEQIETSPLWLRSNDKLPDFKLLPSGARGLPGEEIDQGIAKPVDDVQFTSITSFTSASLDELAENEGEKTVSAGRKTDKLCSTSKMSTIAELEAESLSEEKESDEGSHKSIETSAGNTSKNDSFEAEHSNSKIRLEKRKSIFSEKRKTKKVSNNVLEHITECFFDWTTIETFIFLHGEEKLRQVLKEDSLSSLLGSLRLAEDKTQHHSKYKELCRKLHLKELAEDKFDQMVIGKELKPLPDYDKLKNESETMDLKVRSFFQGVPYQVEEDEEDKEAPVNKIVEKGENENLEEGLPAVLPLADINSQNALRRKVFLNSLNKVLQNFAELFHFSIYNIQSDVSGLVKTFKLRADNVVFKPIMWNIIGIIILRILSIKNEYLKEIIDSSASQHHIKQILKPFTNSEDLLGEILFKYSDLNSFVERYLNERM